MLRQPSNKHFVATTKLIVFLFFCYGKKNPLSYIYFVFGCLFFYFFLFNIYNILKSRGFGIIPTLKQHCTQQPNAVLCPIPSMSSHVSELLAMKLATQ